MQFTDIEKKAVARVLFHFMSADGVIEDAELDLQKKIISFLEIRDESFIITIVKFPIEQALEILRHMKEDKKTEVEQFIAKMIVADGNVDKRELELAATIEKTAGIDVLRYFPYHKT